MGRKRQGRGAQARSQGACGRPYQLDHRQVIRPARGVKNRLAAAQTPANRFLTPACRLRMQPPLHEGHSFSWVLESRGWGYELLTSVRDGLILFGAGDGCRPVQDRPDHCQRTEVPIETEVLPPRLRPGCQNKGLACLGWRCPVREPQWQWRSDGRG